MKITVEKTEDGTVGFLNDMRHLPMLSNLSLDQAAAMLSTLGKIGRTSNSVFVECPTSIEAMQILVKFESM